MARGRGRYVQTAQQRYARAQARLRGRGRGNAALGRGRRGLGPAAATPFDSQAMRESTRLGNEAADTRVGLGARFEEVQQNLGFGAGADNPYSEAAQLKKQYAANKRGITNTAGNQLYAGSTINAQSQARSDFDTGQKRLEDSYARAQAAYDRGVAQTNRDETLGRAEIKEGAIGRAAASAPSPLAVGRGRGRATGRGRRPINEARNVRRPQQARRLNARARNLNARINRGRGR